MAEDIDVPAELQKILIIGQLQHTFDFFGQEVQFDLFTSEVEETVSVRTSGLDADAKRVVKDLLELAHAITRFGKYNFKGSFEEKLRFVRALMPPVRRLLVEELRQAELKQLELMNKRRAELKKPSPAQP